MSLHLAHRVISLIAATALLYEQSGHELGCNGTGRIGTGPVGDWRGSRIARCVRIAEDVNGIARRELTPREGDVGKQREIENRERADGVEGPGRKALHDGPLLRRAHTKRQRAFPD
jgi:hypothetical protein